MWGLLGRIAQLVRALPLQGRGHRFDPCSAYHDVVTDFLRGRRSAWLGRQIVNLEVAGSNPVGPAIFSYGSCARAMLFRSGFVEFLSSLSLVSKIVLLALVLFSIASWAIILYKWRLFRALETSDRRFLKAFTGHEYPLEASREVPHYQGSALVAVYAEVAVCYQLGGNNGEGVRLAEESARIGDEGLPTQRYVERVLAHAIQEQINKAESYLPFLATTGNITPFVGLLGTVLGIIDAFREIGLQGTASISAVAPGVAEALVATAAGLFTAIPAVIAYNYFLSRVRQMAFRMDRFAIELTNALEMRGIREGTGQR